MRMPRGAALFRFATLVFCVLAVLGAPRAAAAGDGADDDLQRVYCLSAAHRAQLVAAAASLELVQPMADSMHDLSIRSRQYTVEEWRRAAPDDFARACSALMATVPQLKPADEPNPLLSALDVVLPLVAGSLLTLAVQRLDARANRRQQQREELRRAAARYRLAAHDYVDAWVDDPGTSDAEVSRTAFELAAELEKVRHARGGHERVDRILAALPVAPGGEGAPPNHAERVALRGRELRRVAETVGETEALIRDDGRPFPRPFRRSARRPLPQAPEVRG
ncbi:hypothetical protein [Sphaerisporangium fuscum]|uniref:hypothetical protein n=1 Tax=Sphaerisporangium fuscum TaxID=2835868 RepID=UPI001BDC5F0B|nr:hypothetical protein [Sphaerisporangium fuscum]